MSSAVTPMVMALLGACCIALGARPHGAGSVTRTRMLNRSAPLRKATPVDARLVRYCGVGATLILGILLNPLVVGLGVGAALLVWRWRTKSVEQSAAAARLRALANTVDMFAVVLGSGGTISTGVDVVARRGDPAIRSTFVEMRDAQAIGQPLVGVLQSSLRRLGEAYRPMVRALAATERDGAPIATLLLRLAEQADMSRQADAETRAKQLSIHLLLPLTMCFLPAVLLGAVVPFVLISAGRFTQ